MLQPCLFHLFYNSWQPVLRCNNNMIFHCLNIYIADAGVLQHPNARIVRLVWQISTLVIAIQFRWGGVIPVEFMYR